MNHRGSRLARWWAVVLAAAVLIGASLVLVISVLGDGRGRGERPPAATASFPSGRITADLPTLHQVQFEREIRLGWKTDFSNRIVPQLGGLQGALSRQ